MTVKEFKKMEVINVEMSIYSADYEKIVSLLEQVGVKHTRREREYHLSFKASLKQLLRLQELGLFDLVDVKLRINCQRDLFNEEEA